MNNITISESIKYIGVDDTTLDLFESQYIVPHGVSYNSYLILDEKIAVMDTVDARKTKEWFDNLDKELKERVPDYLIVSHLEPDHSANIQLFTEKYKEAKLVLSAKAKAMLPQFFNIEGLDERCIVVKEGEELDLGNHHLKFIMAPMVHWPEVMVEYETTEKVLFSADGFGKFGVLSHDEDWACEARRYYFNIVGKYGAPVQALLKKASTLDIKMICPLHGPILKDNLGYYIDKYQIWSSYQSEDEGVLVASASIHGNTKEVALKVVDLLKEKGVKVAFTDLTRDDMAEAMDRFGSDKPDLRFGMELTDVTDVVKNCGFSVFTGAVENGGSVRGINAKGQGGMPRKKIDKLTAFVKDYGAKGLAYIAIQEDGSIKSSFAKFMMEEEMDALIKAMGAEAGDLLLFAADKNKVVWDSLGALRVELAKQLELLDKNEFRFVWITEFPLLEWSEEQNRYVAMHHPFTMPMEEDLPLIDSDPGKVRAKAYDIVLNGNEIGGGSVRIFQDDIQEKMFEVLGFTKEQAYSQFGFLLDAFKYGVPPHAGLAYGLDRLVMLMAKQDSIRDVIAFPKVKDASCLMTEAPSVVDVKQLNELGLETTAETEK